MKSSDLARIAESVIREMDEMGINPEDNMGGEFDEYDRDEFDPDDEFNPDDEFGPEEEDVDFTESYRRRRRPMRESRRRARIRRIVRETLRRRRARAMRESRRRRYYRSNW